MSRFDRGDGPSNAASRLHKALLALGVDSVMFVSEVRGAANDPTVQCFAPRQEVHARLRRRLHTFRLNQSMGRYRRSRPTGYEAFSDDRTPYASDPLAQLPAGDVINVHAMFRFLDYRTFFATVPARMPVVRTMHDMNFFTGGCHIAGGCERYLERCGACPQLGSRNVHDLSRQIWERKDSALRTVPSTRLHAVAASRWLATEARRSRLLRDIPVSVIPFGIETDVFSPREKRWARETLGIPSEVGVVLFVAEPISRPLKGLRTLVAALNEGTGHNVMLLSVGSGWPPAGIRVPHLGLGRIENERLLSLVYSAADVVAVPSSQETFSLVCLEAMACGVPVVGSAVGGIAEIVRPGLTGMLVPPHDAGALRTAISELLTDPARRAAMAYHCRRVAGEEYSLELYARRYLDLYTALVGGRTPPAPAAVGRTAEHSTSSPGASRA